MGGMKKVLTAWYDPDQDETAVEWTGGDMSSLQQADVLQDIRCLLDDEYELAVVDFFGHLSDVSPNMETCSHGLNVEATLDALLDELSDGQKFALLSELSDVVERELNAARHIQLKQVAEKMGKHPFLSSLAVREQ